MAFNVQDNMGSDDYLDYLFDKQTRNIEMRNDVGVLDEAEQVVIDDFHFVISVKRVIDDFQLEDPSIYTLPKDIDANRQPLVANVQDDMVFLQDSRWISEVLDVEDRLPFDRVIVCSYFVSNIVLDFYLNFLPDSIDPIWKIQGRAQNEVI